MCSSFLLSSRPCRESNTSVEISVDKFAGTDPNLLHCPQDKELLYFMNQPQGEQVPLCGESYPTKTPTRTPDYI